MEEKKAKEERLVEQLEKERLQDKEKDDIEKKAEDILTKIQKEIASNKTSFQNEQDKVPGHNDSRTKMREKSEASLEHNKQEKVDNDKRNISNSAVRGENSVNSVEKSDNVLQERTSKPCAITNEVTTDDYNKSGITEMLPESLEKRRLQWMEQCIPWGKVIGETKGQARRSAKSRIGKRPASAKQLPDLSDYLLRQASPENTTLKQVKTVQVQGLSGCSMCSLKQCPSVRSISLVQCGIVAVEGISDCKLLQHLNLQHNKVESLNCQDLQRLQELLMSSNSLTSVHGLDGCVDVRVADFSNNRITRTGGFESCHKLTRLLLDHNQLINTRGLHNSPSIQVLDLSHNHLSSVQDLDKCCLLKTLNLTGNSLQEPPQLRNHVLLRQLFLDDNSLSSLEVLSKAWLPLLEHLSVSQNSLSEVTSLANLLLLKSLDVSHNCIADVNSLLTGIEECHRLQHLSIQGNPLTEESQYRSSILAKLPWLQKLDSEDVTPSVSHDQSRPMSSFEVMCISQIQRQNDMQARHRKQLQETRERYPGYTDTLLDLKSRQFDEVHDLAIQHRYMHEYGDLTEDTGIQDDGNTADVMLGDPEGGALSRTAGKKSVTFRDSAGSKASVSVPANVVGKSLMRDDDEQFHRAAVKIQSLWRGYSVRQEISEHTQRWLAATIIQACWRGHSVRQQIRHYIPEFYARREPALHRQPYPPAQTITSPQMQPCPPPHNAMPSHRRGNQRDFIFRNDTSGPHSDMINGNIAISPLENMAATKIQALWRGYIIRKRIREFKDAVKFDDGEEDDFFGEFDLSNFEFNEASLEQGWSPAETPQIPVSHPILPPTPPVQPHPPRQAWRGASSPMVNDRSQPTPLGKPPLPPGSSMSTETPRTHASSKQEKISEEWGFKDSTTAELMLKRAKKMHRKKKIIDPKKKFELFKKLQESTKLNSVQPPARKQSNKQDYFHARQQMQNFMDMQSRSATEQKQQMVFEWVHTQAGPYSGADTPQPNKRPPATNLGRHTHSDSSLPHIDPQVLEGGRVQLVASPSIELESVGDTSTVASSPDKRRHSFSSPNDERVQFPPLKTNSAPSSHTRERMAATEQFAGWGGGRRRNKYK
ncbi:leucine-rich repeat- and IQ domain-containing protein 1-like [Ptychodera flava]|uniref:leucine-rich repeat- and IQ domain-containing protein 1-like n=1 Tax=Ptychodera flava TaxID=63121 RepID=UPI00396A8F9C